jgi:hypothetical protein
MTQLHNPLMGGDTIPHQVSIRDTRTASVAFPYCNMRGGLCETLLTSLPIAIIVIQFIRDGYEVVQDGIITVANEKALQAFAPGSGHLTGSLFLPTCSTALPHGAWHRCLWVASSGKAETMISKPDDINKQSRSLTIAPYGDGLLLAFSHHYATNTM